MEKVWEHAVETRLKIKLSDHPVLISEKPFNSSQARMKYTVSRLHGSVSCAGRQYLPVPRSLLGWFCVMCYARWSYSLLSRFLCAVHLSDAGNEFDHLLLLAAQNETWAS